MNKFTQPKAVKGQEHVDKGNMHYFGEIINSDLNKNVRDEGYEGGILFWHNDETGNPFSPGLDLKGDKPIFFIPNESARQIFTREQLIAFYKEMKSKGYFVEQSTRF